MVRVLLQYLKEVQGEIRKSYFQSRGILKRLHSNDEDILKIQNTEHEVWKSMMCEFHYFRSKTFCLTRSYYHFCIFCW